MRVLISGILVGIVAIMVAVVAVSRNKTSEVSPSPSGSRFVLAVLESKVSAKNSADTDFVEVDKETDVHEGDQIKTDQTGHASILYPNGHIVDLGVSSMLTLKNLENNGSQSTLRLFGGSVRSKLQNILNKGDFYQVETENMVAAVRGTDFLVTSFAGVSAVLVYENEVEVQAVDPKTGQLLDGGFIKLFAGEKAVVDSANLPSKDKPLKKIKIESFQIPSASLTKSSLISVQPTVIPSPRPTPRPFPTPTPTPSPGLLLNKTVSSPTAIPTPAPKTIITLVTPAKLQKPEGGNAEFAINGQYLTGAKAVFLNQLELQFFVVDSFTIFATVGPNIKLGIYDVSVIAANGEKLTLYRAIEIQ